MHARLGCVVGTHISVHQVPTPVSRETAHSHAVTAVGKQRKYYSSDNDFLSASKCVTASPLCHLLEDSRFLSACRGKHTHRAIFIVSLEAAVFAQSIQSQSFALKDSSLSFFQGTGMINFF